MKTLIIAEAGVNHNGSMDLAYQQIDGDAGADIVKFQTFKAENLVTKSASKAQYQLRKQIPGIHFEMIKRLELPKRCISKSLINARTKVFVLHQQV